jgi:hypothetical protein
MMIGPRQHHVPKIPHRKRGAANLSDAISFASIEIPSSNQCGCTAAEILSPCLKIIPMPECCQTTSPPISSMQISTGFEICQVKMNRDGAWQLKHECADLLAQGSMTRFRTGANVLSRAHSLCGLREPASNGSAAEPRGIGIRSESTPNGTRGILRRKLNVANRSSAYPHIWTYTVSNDFK